MEEVNDHLPFRKPTEFVGSSSKSEVMGYENSPLVVKIKQPRFERKYDSVDGAIESINEKRRLIEETRSAIEKMGSDPEIVPTIEAVIHSSSDNDKITYTKTQEKYPDSKTVSACGLDMLSLPTQSLKDLKNMFQININFWKKYGAPLDIVGSSNNLPNLKKLIRHFLPVFFSENIIIDSKQIPRFIDPGALAKSNDIKGMVRQNIQVVGSFISIGILNLTISINKLKK